MGNRERKIFLFAGGGTGGHLYPGLAIAQRLQQLVACEIHFIGTAKGIETKVVPEHGYPLHLISVRGFARNRIWINLLLPLRLLVSLVQCGRLVRKLQPDVVVGTGGYASGPMLYMAHRFGVATLIQEQNCKPGVTTRILARYADQIHLSFKESSSYFKPSDRIHLTGNPVRSLEVSASVPEARHHFGLASERMTLLVFGGSQGARVINRTMAGVLPKLMAQTDLQILWACGKGNAAALMQTVAAFSGRVQVQEYIAEMPMAYRAADLVVCRAGALTLAELARCGLPAVLIPLASAAANHQASNALALQQQGAAVVILESELNEDVLQRTIVALAKDAQKRNQMGESIRATAVTDATDRLARSVLALGERKGEGR